MVITWYGEDCFKIQSGDLVVLTDPFDSKIGILAPRLKSDITIKTLAALPHFPPLNGESFLISGPGEYDLKGTKIIGLPLTKESTEKFVKSIYILETEGIRICFLGHLSEPLEPSQLEKIEDIDILIFPAGGSPFISQKEIVKLIRNIEPKIAIPSFYKIPKLSRKTDDLKKFLEEFNHKKEGGEEPEEKLTIKKKEVLEIKPTQLTILKI